MRALEKAGFRVARQGKHVVMTNGSRILTIPDTTPSMPSPWAVLLVTRDSPSTSSSGCSKASAGTPGAGERARASGATLNLSYRVEIEREVDGRFLAEVIELPGVMAYGRSAENALAYVQALALRVIAEQLDHEDGPRGPVSIRFETSLEA